MDRSPTRAWDEVRPPEQDLIDDCVHCGFCLPTCPTYTLWDEEMDSPRGRIVLMRAGLEEGSELSAPVVTHLDNCLGCMACVTACPSGVQYDKLIEDTRAQVERNWKRPRRERLLRRAIFAVFPHPGRLRALVPGMWLQHKLPIERLERRPRLRALAQVARLAPKPRLRDAVARLPEHTPARGERRGTVGLLQGCVQRVLFNDVNVATVRVLAAEGFDVHAPRMPRCCGALQLHSGEDGPARARARETITAFADHDVVLVNAAGCGSALKDYGHLLRDDADWAERATEFSAKVRDVTEFLAEVEPRAPRRPIGIDRIAYHDACHLAHAQGVRAQPRALLRAIPELEVVEPEGWEICCGSAGIYNLTNPEPAAELGRRKVANLRATGTTVIAAANPGCSIQIAAIAEQDGEPLRVYHPLELHSMTIGG
ncbi:MAG: glycolate oxidase iron-sulfur subunit, partial [Thermoleophilales bacterium]|nr:glycolate oxidase iron-sulfur subunit [Thermoleophilales bacterium]